MRMFYSLSCGLCYLSVTEHTNLNEESRLLAVGLGIPEETFIDMHGFQSQSDTWRKQCFLIDSAIFRC